MAHRASTIEPKFKEPDMAQIDTKNFADIVARACAEARSIAERAASDPTVYLNPEIEAWGKKYCARDRKSVV